MDGLDFLFSYHCNGTIGHNRVTMMNACGVFNCARSCYHGECLQNVSLLIRSLCFSYDIRTSNINPAGERFSSLLVRQVSSAVQDYQFRCTITYDSITDEAVFGGAVQSAGMTLKLSEISSFTATPADPITGTNVVLSCEATGETAPTFTFYTVNRKILDPTYFTTVTDKAVSTSGTTYTATMTVKAEAPNILRSGETIYCMVRKSPLFSGVI